ncbi:MAG: cytochrome c oxidase subunit II [Alphaproteobacteria bacterium]|nr:cytochrome c oxidase subunit II [Alphaproteobacteria bacterium]
MTNIRIHLMRGLGLIGLAALFGFFAAPAMAQQPVPWQLGFQDAHSPIMEQMTLFHDFLLWVIFAISIFVLGLLLYAIVRFRESKNPIPSKVTHNTLIEVLWTVVPVVILFVIGFFSLPLLYATDDTAEADLTIKAIGRQWYWSYEYPDHGDFTFDAFMVPEDELKEGQPRLLTTDEALVLPVGKKVRVLVTSSDVLHAFAMPALGSKIDAVPGRINETWFEIDEPGIYYGQCSELCGSGHAFMPQMIRAVPEAEFDAWINKAQARFGGSAEELSPRPIKVVRNEAVNTPATAQ